jgi:hypothetical protein
MDTVPGKGTDAIAAVCAKHGCYVAIGIAEIDPDTRLTYSTGDSCRSRKGCSPMALRPAPSVLAVTATTFTQDRKVGDDH